MLAIADKAVQPCLVFSLMFYDKDKDASCVWRYVLAWLASDSCPVCISNAMYVSHKSSGMSEYGIAYVVLVFEFFYLFVYRVALKGQKEKLFKSVFPAWSPTTFLYRCE